MGRVSVAEPSEWLRISADRVKLFNRNLNVNDWLRFQTRNGSRTIVIDSTGQLSQRTRNSVPFRFELESPAWIVRHDLQSLAHNGQPSAASACSAGRNEILPSSHLVVTQP